MAGIGITRPVPGTRSGEDYGVFTGRPLEVVEDVTALAPGPGPGQGYGDFTKVVVSTSGLTLADILERIGGAPVSTLFDLSVTAPTPRTWKLAVQGINDVPGVYRPLVLGQPALSTAAALGGRSAGSGVTLTIANGEGSGEAPGRKFMDAFSTHVDGYSEPYDLNTMTLQMRLYSPLLPNQPFIIGAALALQPSSVDVAHVPGEPETVRLTFGPDERRYQVLPPHMVTEPRYSHAPASSLNQPIIPWFGVGLRVPTLPVDADGGLYLIGASPLATPLGGVTACWTERPDPGATDSNESIVFPVRLTTAGEVVLSIPGETIRKFETFTKQAERFELPTAGAFIHAVRLWLRRTSAGTAPVGSIQVSIRLDNDGQPGETLVDRWATGEVNAAIVTSGTAAPFDIPFQANELARAAFVIGTRALWIIATYAKDGGGDLQIEVDTTGAYATGVMATQNADKEWVLTGKQQRRGPVRQDFTGGGTLVRNVTTGAIKTRSPVSVPGL